MILVAPIDTFTTLLSANAGFQTFVGGNAQAAAAKIYRDFLPAPADKDRHTRQELIDFRPFALVWQQEQSGWVARRDAAGGCFRLGGSILVHLEWNVPPNITDQAASLQFNQHLSRIIHDESGSTGILQTAIEMNITRVECMAIYRALIDVVPTMGDYYAAELKIDWGFA